MKKLGVMIACACLIIFGGVFLTACGEQFIVERNYQLINMQVIEDNTPNNGHYSHFEPGEWTTYLTGCITLDKCIVSVGQSQSILKFDDSDETGISADYTFEVYTNSNEYPTYKLSNIKIYFNGVEQTLEQISQKSLTGAQLYLLESLAQFNFVMEYGETSIQLVTQNKSFSCHIMMQDKQTNGILFMGLLFGY